MRPPGSQIPNAAASAPGVPWLASRILRAFISALSASAPAEGKGPADAEAPPGPVLRDCLVDEEVHAEGDHGREDERHEVFVPVALEEGERRAAMVLEAGLGGVDIDVLAFRVGHDVLPPQM